MRRFWALYRVLLKCGQGTQEALQKNNRKKKAAKALSATGEAAKKALITILLLAVMVMMGFVGYESYPAYVAEGIFPQAVSATLFLGILIMIVGSFPMVLSSFFLSKDVSSYIFMPFKPREIVAAKFLTTLSIAYLMMLIMVLPQLIGFGVGGGFGAGYYAIAVIACALLPIVPTAYLAVISMILMRVFRKVENKETWVVVATYAIAVIFIAIQFIPGEESGFEGLMSVLMYDGQAAAILNGIFPNLGFIQQALVNSDFIMLAIDILITAAIVIAFMILSDLLYIRGAMGLSDGGGRRKGMSTARREKLNRPTTPAQAYARKERWSFWRTPTFSMRCLYMAIILPIVFIGSAALGTSGAIDLAVLFGGADAMTFFFIPMACAFLSGFVATLNGATPTCLSRQGAGFTADRALPIPDKARLSGMSAVGRNISLAIGIGFSLILTGIATGFGADPWTMFFGVAVAVPMVLFINNCQLYYATGKPNLQWESEEMAIRRAGILVHTCITLLTSAVVGVIGGVLSAAFGKPGAVIGVIVMFALLVGAAAVSHAIAYTSGPGRMARIEG